MATALGHYLIVRDEDYRRAAAGMGMGMGMVRRPVQ
jgi:hypothetical protein